MKKLIFILFLSLIFDNSSIAQTDKVPADFCISQEEYQLYLLISDYRLALSLPPISLSKSLSYVAKTHVKDLAANYNPKSSCNMHSWSNKGKWIPICFPAEQSKKNNVRMKAKEIIGYPAEAYELTYWSNIANNPNHVFDFWLEKIPSANMLFNRNEWESTSWKAIGIGMKNGYAVVWLGKTVDYEVSTSVCGTNTKVLNEASPEYKATNSPLANSKNPAYYITIASFAERRDAVNAVRSYKEMGYPKTVLIEVDNKIRVAIDYFTDKKEADQALKKYAPKFKGAWVLTI